MVGALAAVVSVKYYLWNGHYGRVGSDDYRSSSTLLPQRLPLHSRQLEEHRYRSLRGSVDGTEESTRDAEGAEGTRKTRKVMG